MARGVNRPVNKWMVLISACGGLFMIMLQSNVINVAISKIQADLHTDLITSQWVTSGYLLAFTMLLITMGRLGDALGRKRVFLAGLVVYTLGSLFSAFASAMGIEALIVGSLIQGLGGAAMMPATQSLIAANFEERERGMALGIWGATSGLAVAIGPTLGGALAEYGLGSALNAFFGIYMGWRYIYFLNVLLGGVVITMAAITIPESRDDAAARDFDVVGVILSSLAIFFLVFGINRASVYGWWDKKADFAPLGINLSPGGISVVPFILMAAALLLGAFILWQAHRQDRALMDIRIFANRDFSAGALTAAILSFSMMGTTFLVPVFLQGVLKFSAIQAGLSMLPLALAVIVASPLAGSLSDRLGSKWVVASGLAIMSVGSFTLANFSLETKVTALIIPFIIVGLGIGLAMSPITAAALRRVPDGKVGGASGLLSTIRQLGSTLGITILVSLFSSLLPAYIVNHSVSEVRAIDSQVLSDSVKDKIVEGLKSATSQSSMSAVDTEKMLKFYAPAKRERIKQAMTAAMTRGPRAGMCQAINETFRWAAAVAALGAISALFLSRKRRDGNDEKA